MKTKKKNLLMLDTATLHDFLPTKLDWHVDPFGMPLRWVFAKKGNTFTDERNLTTVTLILPERSQHVWN